MIKKDLIIDGNNIAMRSHFKLKTMSRADGAPTGMLFGFLNTLLSLQDRFSPDRLIVAWDGGRASWRLAMYPEYKATREPKSDDDAAKRYEMYGIMDELRSILPSLNVGLLHEAGQEADDLIAAHTMASKNKVAIYSSDNDFLQLADKGATIVSPSTDGLNDTLMKLGCNGREYLYAKCFAGETSDNISGFVGIGVPTALKVVRQIRPSCIEDFNTNAAYCLYANSHKRWWQVRTTSFNDIVRRNYFLMSFEYAVTKLPQELQQPKPGIGEFCREALLDFFAKHELKSFASNPDRFNKFHYND